MWIKQSTSCREQGHRKCRIASSYFYIPMGCTEIGSGHGMTRRYALQPSRTCAEGASPSYLDMTASSEH